MTDNTNIETDIPAFMDQYRKEHPEAAEYSDAKIQYNLDRGWILGWRMARRAALSNAEPFAYLWKAHQYDNWEEVPVDNAGDKGVVAVFLHPSVPAPQWQPIESAPKDQVIDLWHKDVGRFVDQWWVKEDDCWSCTLSASAFTHWMPIAPAPLTNTGEQG